MHCASPLLRLRKLEAELLNISQPPRIVFIYSKVLIVYKSRTPLNRTHHKRYRSRQLNLGYPTAHMRIHLMLLPSGPDMIHGFILHRTEIFKHYVLRADFTKLCPQQRN